MRDSQYIAMSQKRLILTQTLKYGKPTPSASSYNHRNFSNSWHQICCILKTLIQGVNSLKQFQF